MAAGAEGLDERSDDELMQMARDGQRLAFHALVRRYQARAVAFSARYLGQGPQAREVAQEAFVELYFTLPRYQPRGRFPSFWHQILLNQCRMAVRARRTSTEAFELLGAQPAIGTPPLADEVLIAQQNRRDIERALATLSEKLRVVVSLRFAAGLSLQQVADTLELPVGTVKSRLFAGLSSLRALLKGKEA